MKDDYPDYSRGGKGKPQQSTPRKKKAVEPLVKKVVEPLKATRNCRVGNIELVKGDPVRGLSANQIESLKKRGLLK